MLAAGSEMMSGQEEDQCPEVQGDAELCVSPKPPLSALRSPPGLWWVLHWGTGIVSPKPATCHQLLLEQRVCRHFLRIPHLELVVGH